MRLFVLLIGLALLCACGDKPATMDDFNNRDVTLPGGQVVRAETMFDATDMLRGMMFRSKVAADRGMLFIHRAPGKYSYWMYQVEVPLDGIWMDASKRVVEIAAQMPPCRTAASQCPHYGGHEMAQYVLQIQGGLAAKYGIKLGDYVSW